MSNELNERDDVIDDFAFPADPEDLASAAAAAAAFDSFGDDSREGGGGRVPFAAIVARPTEELPRSHPPPLLGEESHEPHVLSAVSVVARQSAGAPPPATAATTNASHRTLGVALSALLSKGPSRALHWPQGDGGGTGTTRAAPDASDSAELASSVASRSSTQHASSPHLILQQQQQQQQRRRWTAADTLRFYTALQQFGTDFTLIAVLFPGCTREDMRNKFHAEERRNPEKVSAALTATQPIDEDEFARRLEEGAQLRRAARPEMCETDHALIAELDHESATATTVTGPALGGAADVAAVEEPPTNPAATAGSSGSSSEPPSARAGASLAHQGATTAVVEPDDLPLSERYAAQLQRRHNGGSGVVSARGNGVEEQSDTFATPQQPAAKAMRDEFDFDDVLS